MLPYPTFVEYLGGMHTVPAKRVVCGGGQVPRWLEGLLGAFEGQEEPWVECEVDADLKKEEYGLLIPAEGPIRLTAGSQRGIRDGLVTLAQLVKLNGGRGGAAIPAMQISDSPAFARRGVMLDVSRDRIPKMPQFMEILDTLALLKFNHLQLYTEHTFAYAGHEEVWEGWSPLTADEIRTLDAACIERGIELAANQNCFGHMVPWLKLPKYAHLAETHGDWMFDIWARSGPFSLCPTDPASLEFVKGLLGELLPCFSSPLANIGCDETYDIGFGRSKAEVEKCGRAAVYMDFVNKIAAVCRGMGRRAQFWGDIALSHPEWVKKIPEDVISLAWGYEPDSPFEKWGRMLGGGGKEFWVCPGTSTWRTITGRTSERKGNLAVAAREGLKYGASGFLVCDWGDSGHHQQWPLTLHALAGAAQAAWNPKAAVDGVAESALLFGDSTATPTGDAAAWLDELGDADLELRKACGALSHPSLKRLKNQTAVFIDMFKQLDEQREVGTKAAWFETLDRLEDLARRVPRVGEALMRAELEHTAKYACFAAGRGAFRRDDAGGETIAKLRDALRGIDAEHARLWRLRCREGGLAHSRSFFAQIDGMFAERGSGVTMFE